MSSHEEVLQLVRENHFQDLCEIGVWRGDLSRSLYPLSRTMVIVDPMSALWNAFYHNGEPYTCTMGAPATTQWELNCWWKDLEIDLSGALLLRMPSIEAAKHVPNQSLDFVYIDAVHTYEHCLEDVNSWFPKIRRGGIIAGDDYVPEHKAVASAIDLLFGKKDRGNMWYERVP